MIKSKPIHQKDSIGTIKSNFVTSCLAFRGLIPINPTSSIETRENKGFLSRMILGLWDLWLLTINLSFITYNCI